jgi:S1-C subfamily serine protease
VLREVAIYLAGRSEPLNASPYRQQHAREAPAPQGTRRVSLGIVPDYAASGAGVRIAEVRTDTPAAEAGLRAGDIIKAVNETAVHDLRDYSRVLQELAPGDAVVIVYTRNAVDLRATARVTER